MLRLEVSLPDALMLMRGDVVEVAHPDLAALTETLKNHAAGLHTGIGAPVGFDGFALSAMQARSLLPVSARLGRIVTASEGETVSLLLSLGSDDAVRGFSDAVLAPLDQLDPKERLELLRTLDQWLQRERGLGSRGGPVVAAPQHRAQPDRTDRATDRQATRRR